MSLVDDLTGLYNRRGFVTLAQQQMKVARRHKTPLVLIFADLDNMKRINDTLGHKEGDLALARSATFCERPSANRISWRAWGETSFAVLALIAENANAKGIVKRFSQTCTRKIRQAPAGKAAVELRAGVPQFGPAVRG